MLTSSCWLTCCFRTVLLSRNQVLLHINVYVSFGVSFGVYSKDDKNMYHICYHELHLHLCTAVFMHYLKIVYYLWSSPDIAFYHLIGLLLTVYGTTQSTKIYEL